MRKTFLTIAALGLMASPVFAGKYNKTVSVGEKAPTFAGIPALYNGQDASVTLSDIKEDVVVLVFLGNHCPVVHAYEDRLIDFTNDYKGKSVKVVGVAVGRQDGDKLPGIKDYMKEKGSNYLYGYDATQAIGKAYGATNTPQFFVLDKTRKIAYMGAMDDSQKEEGVKVKYLRNAVDAVLKGESPEINETRPVGCGIGYAR
jgi:peroxiredoxin